MVALKPMCQLAEQDVLQAVDRLLGQHQGEPDAARLRVAGSQDISEIGALSAKLVQIVDVPVFQGGSYSSSLNIALAKTALVYHMGLCFTLQYIPSIPDDEGAMATAKTATLTFRIEPDLKTLREAASREHRSIANMVEVLIRDYCKRNGIAIPEHGGLLDDDKKPAKGGRHALS